MVSNHHPPQGPRGGGVQKTCRAPLQSRRQWTNGCCASRCHPIPASQVSIGRSAVTRSSMRLSAGRPHLGLVRGGSGPYATACPL
eukprot:366025-Chlamydomonas_euryale.AAC.15